MKKITVLFKGCSLIIKPDEQYCEVRFNDGSTVPARPYLEQEGFAKELGYENAWQMCRLHDAVHCALAEAKGLNHSPALYRVAHKEQPTPEDWAEEEQVITIQKVINILQKRNLI